MKVTRCGKEPGRSLRAPVFRMSHDCKPLKAFLDYLLVDSEAEKFFWRGFLYVLQLVQQKLRQLVVIAPVNVTQLNGVNLVFEVILLGDAECIFILSLSDVLFLKSLIRNVLVHRRLLSKRVDT